MSLVVAVLIVLVLVLVLVLLVARERAPRGARPLGGELRGGARLRFGHLRILVDGVALDVPSQRLQRAQSHRGSPLGDGRLDGARESTKISFRRGERNDASVVRFAASVVARIGRSRTVGPGADVRDGVQQIERGVHEGVARVVAEHDVEYVVHERVATVADVAAVRASRASDDGGGREGGGRAVARVPLVREELGERAARGPQETLVLEDVVMPTRRPAWVAREGRAPRDGPKPPPR